MFMLTMRARLTILHLLLLSCWLAGCASQTRTADSTPSDPTLVTSIKGTFPTLQKGMSTEVVREKLGAPASVQPMEAPGGHAEVWIYHFEKNVGMAQVATGTREVPALVATISGPAQGMTTEPVFDMVEKRAMITLSLLMFNGELVAQKAKVENRVEYN